jgi:hypothetical protein
VRVAAFAQRSISGARLGIALGGDTCPVIECRVIGRAQHSALSEMVPQSGVIALLVDPRNASAERRIRDVQEAARAKGVGLAILKASTESEIDTAFVSLAQLKPARSSSTLTCSSSPAVTSSSRRQPAMPFQRSMHGTNSPRQAG